MRGIRIRADRLLGTGEYSFANPQHLSGKRFGRRRTAAALDGDDRWDAEAWADAFEPYFEEHEDVGIDANARGADLLLIEETADTWTVRQILDDPSGHHDWAIHAGSRRSHLRRRGPPSST